MKHRLSFAYFNLLSDNIVEVVVDDGIEMTMEMIEECHDFIGEHMTGEFGMLINRVNNYSYTYEAKLSVASYDGLKAIAFVYYSPTSKELSHELYQLRITDKWNYRLFSGLELGWQQAYEWLQKELSVVNVS